MSDDVKNTSRKPSFGTIVELQISSCFAQYFHRFNRNRFKTTYMLQADNSTNRYKLKISFQNRSIITSTLHPVSTSFLLPKKKKNFALCHFSPRMSQYLRSVDPYTNRPQDASVFLHVPAPLLPPPLPACVSQRLKQKTVQFSRVVDAAHS